MLDKGIYKLGFRRCWFVETGPEPLFLKNTTGAWRKQWMCTTNSPVKDRPCLKHLVGCEGSLQALLCHLFGMLHCWHECCLRWHNHAHCHWPELHSHINVSCPSVHWHLLVYPQGWLTRLFRKLHVLELRYHSPKVSLVCQKYLLYYQRHVHIFLQ